MHFTGKLLKQIDLSDAKARRLRAALAAPPDASDQVAFLKSEFQEKWKELDKFFDLDSTRCDIWQQRALVLINLQYRIRPDDPHRWQRLATRLALSQVPGFSINMGHANRHGAPVKWTVEQLAELFADVEFLKKTTGASVRKICADLPKRRDYKERWGGFGGDTLRKFYTRAKALRKTSLEFGLFLSGHDHLVENSDPIGAAIHRHGLKKSLDSQKNRPR